MKVTVGILLAFLAGGCTYETQDVKLAPTFHVARADIGKGVRVSVRVFDERTQKILGHRGGGKGATITTEQDIARLFHEKIIEALTAKGFSPVAYSEEFPTQLRIDVRDLQYYIKAGFSSVGVHTRASIKATANVGHLVFEKMYVTQNERRVPFASGPAANEKQLTETVAGVLQKLIMDQELLVFLAIDPASTATAGK